MLKLKADICHEIVTKTTNPETTDLLSTLDLWATHRMQAVNPPKTRASNSLAAIDSQTIELLLQALKLVQAHSQAPALRATTMISVVASMQTLNQAPTPIPNPQGMLSNKVWIQSPE